MATGEDPTAVERPRSNDAARDSERVVREPTLDLDANAAPTVDAAHAAAAARGWRLSDAARANLVVRQDRSDLPDLVTVDPDHYVIGPELARGGMGRIHAARDRRLGRDVAIKELLVDSEELERRFEREVRITARLQHPSIVSVHEAGRWPDGKPFYAMKLVAGRSLWTAIKQTPALEQRLALLPNVLAVADAMAYAHAQRVIHRDLKPNNIILGEFGETIVIDWGIARSLDDCDPPSTPCPEAPAEEMPPGVHAPRAGETRLGSVVGTPGYMAPEQARGDAVDERVDVYAIGVMLYQLLAGKPPWRGDDPKLLAAMLAGPPALPPEVPADLAAITHRALMPDLDARYPTARELADDLRRFQTGQLVGAKRYTTRELIARWLRRHRTPVLVASVAALALATVGAYSVTSVVRERHTAELERARAVKRGADAEDAMGFMLFDVAEKLRQAGRLELMDTVVRRAIDYYSTVADRDVDPTRLVKALMVIGDVLRAEGDLSAARQEYRRAERIAAARQLEGPVWQHLLAGAYDALGDTAYAQGDLQAAIALYRKALALGELLVAGAPADPRWQADLAKSQRLAAIVLEDQGEIATALGYLRASLAIRIRLAMTQTDPEAQRDLMMTHSDLGQALSRTRDGKASLAELHAALDLAERLAKTDPDATTAQKDLAFAHERIGEVLVWRGDLAGALAEFEQNLASMTKLAGMDSANADWQRRLANAHARVGEVQLELGKLETALEELAASRALRRALVERDPTNARWQRDLSHATVRYGDALLADHDPKAALAAYREAQAARDQLAARDTTSVKWQSDLFSSHRRIGNALLAMGDAKAARTELEAAEALETTVLARDRTALDDHDRLELHERLAAALRATGDPVRALAELETAIALAKQRAEREPEDTRRGELVQQLEAKR